uniref:Uncharacterized protein n=1 Tax=Rhizophora mucronata TaxID=61149 RepID=A0A2P2JE32_RHIMU
MSHFALVHCAKCRQCTFYKFIEIHKKKKKGRKMAFM